MTTHDFVVPDLIEPIIGYRSWTIRVHPSGEPRLCSPYRRSIWLPGEVQKATCGMTNWTSPIGIRPAPRAAPGHEVPAAGCTCGVHAWRSRGAALLDAADTRGLRAVSGELALCGSVLKHTRGWRSAFAYPRALTVHATTTDGLCFVFTWESGQLRAVPAEELAPALSEVYGVPVGIDPGEDPLGPLPRYAPSALRLPRAHLGITTAEAALLYPQPSRRRRLVAWLTHAR
ncbi:MAG: hypothetical protein EXQ67_01510 [Thermoleophilia bacterium]|nr:hypothetical protein [Thermoleophilia bacterium]